MERRHESPGLQPRSGQRVVVWSLLAVVAFFLTATVISRMTEHSMESTARSIASDAAPSIKHLSEARAQQRALELALQRVVEAPRDARLVGLEEEARATLGAVDASLAAYYALPPYPGERDVWGSIAEEQEAVRAGTPRLLKAIEQGREEVARRVLEDELLPPLRREQSNTIQLIEFNAATAQQLARHMSEVHRRSNQVAFALDTLGVLLAGLVAWVAVRELRRFQELNVAHAELLERRADELEQFSGRVAHDILSPLVGVGLALELAGRADEARRKSALTRGLSSLRQVRRIVDGLLDFARAGARPDPLAQTDVDALFSDLAQELLPEAAAADVRLTFACPEPCSAACSPGVLTSIVGNLVRNAIKYMGRSIERQVSVRALATAERVRLEVKDTGVGLPAPLAPVVFQPYVRGKGNDQPGIGLGLATVKRLADAHGGRVGVESVEGKGSLFWVELPRAHALGEAESGGRADVPERTRTHGVSQA